MSQRLAGALFIALLGASVGFVLLTSGRTLGSGQRFDVELATTGALKPGARVRIAGREAGEVRALRWDKRPDGTRHVIAECFVQSAWAQHLRVNSEFFIATPSVLGEAYLEIGPPRAARGGEPPAPGRPLADGETVRGVDPPELDRMVARLYGNLTTIALMFREDRPAFDELVKAAQSLLDTLSGLPQSPGQLARIRDQVMQAVDDGRALVNDLDDAHAIARGRLIARDLGEVARKAGPELAAIGVKASAVIERVQGLSDIVSPERRARVSKGAEALSHAATIGAAIAREVEALAAMVERGEGSVGAFLHDHELYDDLHDVHRILKSQPWTLIVKPPPGVKTITR